MDFFDLSGKPIERPIDNLDRFAHQVGHIEAFALFCHLVHFAQDTVYLSLTQGYSHTSLVTQEADNTIKVFDYMLDLPIQSCFNQYIPWVIVTLFGHLFAIPHLVIFFHRYQYLWHQMLNTQTAYFRFYILF